MKKFTMEENQIKILIDELENLGISRDFLDEKAIENIYEAKRIVEEFDENGQLTQREKKALIQSILDNHVLNIKRRNMLPKLIQNFRDMGLSEQEINIAIINLGVNGRILEQTGYGYTYSDLLMNIDNSCDIIKIHKEELQKCSVSDITMLTALSKTLDESEKGALKQEIGLPDEVIENKHIRDLYMAKAIVERYDFEKELTSQQKRALIQAILNNSYIDNKKPHLSALMRKFELIGLDEQEVYGTVINLSVNGRMIEEKNGYSYRDFLSNNEGTWETIGNLRNRIDTQVENRTILTAVSKYLSEEEQNKLLDELLELGLSKEFIELKSVENLYMAKEIVEGYEFSREFTRDEKRIFIQLILHNKFLNKEGKKTVYLSRLMQRFENAGLDEQEIYGAILNLGINGNLTNMTGGFTYTELLINKNDVFYDVERCYRDQMYIDITEDRIQKASLKSEKIMQRALRNQKNKGQIENQMITRNAINDMTRQEIEHEQDEELER